MTDTPSGAESLGRTPFVGAPGEVLAATVRAVASFSGRTIEDLSEEVAVFHALARPTIGGKAPKIADVRACRARLIEELTAARPRAVLSVGASACASLSGAVKPTMITAWRGQMRWLVLGERRVPWVATISAGAVVARPDLYRDFVYDVWKVWTQRAPLAEPRVVVVEGVT